MEPTIYGIFTRKSTIKQIKRVLLFIKVYDIQVRIGFKSI